MLSASPYAPCRWNLIPNVREKRAIFESFCKNIGAEQKKLAAEKGRAAIEGFKALMEEAAALERRLRLEEMAGVCKGCCISAGMRQGCTVGLLMLKC